MTRQLRADDALRERRADLATALDVVVVAVLASVVSVIGLGTKSLWTDEGYSAVQADTRGTHNFLVAWYHGDANQTLYYLLLHFWSYLGTTEAALRSLSVIFAVAGAVMTYALGRDLLGRAVGLTAGVLLALNAFAVTYAQNVRGYSLLLLLAVTSTFLFLRTLNDGRRRYWIGYAVVTAAGFYVHYFMAMVVATQIAYFAMMYRRRASWQPQLRNWGAAIVLAVPILVHAARTGDSQINWIAPATPSSVLHLGYRLSGGRVLCGLTAIALLGVAFVAARRRSTPEGRAALIAVLGVALPLILGIGASAAITPLIVDRYYIECVPMIALTLSIAIWQLPRLALSLAALGAILAGSIAGVAFWYHETSWQDWRATAAYLEGLPDTRPNILNAFQAQALQYYFERDDSVRASQYDAQPTDCREFATPKCIGESPDVIVITPPNDAFGSALQKSLDRAGYVSGPTKQLGPILITRYLRTAESPSRRSAAGELRAPPRRAASHVRSTGRSR